MTNLKISTELISSVLVKETRHLTYDTIYVEDNFIIFSYEGEYQFEVSIYEFAFKCKEWALSKGHILSSNNYNNGGSCQVFEENGYYCKKCGEDVTTKSINSFTEIEAIIKVCEWIQENIK